MASFMELVFCFGYLVFEFELLKIFGNLRGFGLNSFYECYFSFSVPLPL